MIEFPLLTLLFDFSVDTSPNRVIFDFVDSSLNYLSKNLVYLLSHLNSLSNLIKFLKNSLNSLHIRPLLTIIIFN